MFEVEILRAEDKRFVSVSVVVCGVATVVVAIVSTVDRVLRVDDDNNDGDDTVLFVSFFEVDNGRSRSFFWN